jgi:hypothetical protein
MFNILIGSMDADSYYEAPSNSIFNAIKEGAEYVWKQYDNEYGYVDDKLKRFSNIENIKDNAWHIVSMFDINNQEKLWNFLSKEIQFEIIEHCGR